MNTKVVAAKKWHMFICCKLFGFFGAEHFAIQMTSIDGWSILNLSAAAELQKSVKVTYETPRIDPWVQRRTRSWSYRVSTDSFP